MGNILERIERRFRLLAEQLTKYAWKTPEALQGELETGRRGGSPGPAYHALIHIAGPANAHPVWAKNWTDPEGITYYAGEAAPRWTAEEIHKAMAAQIMMWARDTGRKAFGKSHSGRADPNWIDDLAGNMHAALQQALIREKDQGRILSGGGFVSWVTPLVRDAGAKGVGGTNESRRTIGRIGELLAAKTPAKPAAIADRVGEQYRDHSSHKFDKANPFGKYSPQVYRLATELAGALSSGNQEAVQDVKSRLQELEQEVRDDSISVQGTATGKRTIGISHWAKDDSAAKADRDKFFRTSIGSIDAPAGINGNSTIGASIQDVGGVRRGEPAGGLSSIDLSGMDKESIYNAMKLGRGFAGGPVPSYISKLGLVPIEDADYRYLLRLLAHWLPGGKYPGKGTAKDPELNKETGEPSEWVRKGQPWITEPEEILRSLRSESSDKSDSQVLDRVVEGSRPLTTVERDFASLMLGLSRDSPGQPLAQSKVAALRGVSRVRVTTVIKSVAKKLGKTIADVLQEVQSGGGGGASEGSTERPSKDPLSVFTGWMRQYQKESEMDESMDAIDCGIISECVQAVNRLYYTLVVRPIIEGR